jgi:hypothetical protein
MWKRRVDETVTVGVGCADWSSEDQVCVLTQHGIVRSLRQLLIAVPPSVWTAATWLILLSRTSGFDMRRFLGQRGRRDAFPDGQEPCYNRKADQPLTPEYVTGCWPGLLTVF